MHVYGYESVRGSTTATLTGQDVHTQLPSHTEAIYLCKSRTEQ